MRRAGLEVAGTAGDGETALRAVGIVRPDLVLLDVEMPVMDGLVTLRKLRAQGHKMPVIMCSSLTQRGAKVTIEALAGGAQRLCGQALRPNQPRGGHPGAVPGADSQNSRAHQSESAAARLPGGRSGLPCLPLAPPPAAQPIPTDPRCWPSASPPAARQRWMFCYPLCRRLALPVVIVQHMPEMFTKLFAERLNGRCRLPAHEAVEGEPVRPGTIYIAKGNWHMEVQAGASTGSPATLRLAQGPPENHCRPAVDVLFRSMASVYGPGSAGRGAHRHGL